MPETATARGGFGPPDLPSPKRILTLKARVNVEKETIWDNVRANIASGVPWLDRALGTGSIAIVGGGPSLHNYLDEIGACADRPIMALNAAHDFLIERDIIPRYQVMLDARPENVEFVANPRDGVTYLVASQCDPAVFEALAGRDVRMWHASAGGTVSDVLRHSAHARAAGSHIEIGGGCTVGLRALYLAYAAGYTDLHLYGYDSCKSGADHHAYAQELNDNDEEITVEVDGEFWATTATMAKQAYQFQSHAVTLSRAGVEITVHGGGLLNTVARSMHRPIDPTNLAAVEARKYAVLWSMDSYRKYAPGEAYVEEACVRLGAGAGDTLIDFGCGTGRAAAAFQDRGLNVVGVDHAVNCLDEGVEVPLCVACLWDLPEPLSARFGFCTDVMEHIPPEKVIDTLQGIHDATEAAFFVICTEDDSFGELIGERLHLTVRPSAWWTTVLEKIWPSVEVTRLAHGLKAIVKRENVCLQ